MSELSKSTQEIQSLIKSQWQMIQILTCFHVLIGLRDHNQAIAETHALGLYAESIKKGICDLPDCFCHELAAMKNQEEKEDELT